MSEDLRRKLPNAITMARLILAVGFFATLNLYRYPDTNPFWANLSIVLFCLAAATDFLDGYLARKWDATTMFGRIMDPFCDKFLILGGFIYLAGPRFIAPEWVSPSLDALDPAVSGGGGGEDSFFTMTTGVYPWMVVLIFGRELLVTSIRGVLESMGISGGAKMAGKIKMILQSLTIPIIICLVVNFETSRSPWAMWTCHILIYMTLVVTMWSGWPYVTGLAKAMKQMGGEEKVES